MCVIQWNYCGLYNSEAHDFSLKKKFLLFFYSNEQYHRGMLDSGVKKAIKTFYEGEIAGFRVYKISIIQLYLALLDMPGKRETYLLFG